MEEYFDILNENGCYLEYTKPKKEAHQNGLWHRGAVNFIINNKKEILLQKRCATKDIDPNLWDVSVGGHCDKDEFSFETVIRETYEELGLSLKKEDLLFIGSFKGEIIKDDVHDSMFIDCFVTFKDINIKDINIQKEELSEIRYISLAKLKDLVTNKKHLIRSNYSFIILIKFLEKHS